jgi:hypothetical protein
LALTQTPTAPLPSYVRIVLHLSICHMLPSSSLSPSAHKWFL